MPDDPNTGEVEGTPPPWQEVGPKTDQEVQEAIRSGMIEEEKDEYEDQGDDGVEDERHALAVDSAFVVFIQDGEAFGVGKLADVVVEIEDKLVHLEPAAHADTSTMWRGCTEVAKDIQVHEQAAKVVEAMDAHAMRMQQALQQQRAGGGAGRLHVPGQ